MREYMGILLSIHFSVNLKPLPEKSFLTNILQTVLNKLIRVDMGIKMGKFLGKDPDVIKHNDKVGNLNTWLIYFITGLLPSFNIYEERSISPMLSRKKQLFGSNVNICTL